MIGCPATMILPPQTDGVTLRCELQAPHDGLLHVATDPDGVVRRWPDDGSAAFTAGVRRVE